MAKRTTSGAPGPGAREQEDGRAYRILSLDGGGIRGVMSAVWLEHLEKVTGRRVSDCFDLVAGTSTGAILAAAVGRGIPMGEVVALYRDRGREIFPRALLRALDSLQRALSQGFSRPKYAPDGLERELKRVLGQNTRLGDLACRTLITTYDTHRRTPVVFKSFRHEHADQPLWRIVQASASAPTYFPAVEVPLTDGYRASLVDGGVVANNPIACVIAEAVRLNREEPVQKLRIPIERYVVASFGTGTLVRAIPYRQAREWGALEWMNPVGDWRPIFDVLMDGSADAADYIAAQIIPKDRYFRWQTRLEKGMDEMDDASRTNIDALVDRAVYHLSAEGGHGNMVRIKPLLNPA